MSMAQLQELALGLEASEQPFLWVVRPDIAEGKAAVLPEGFTERIGAEQSLNCRFCKDIWKIGMDFESRAEDENALVSREEVEMVVRAMVESRQGKELRKNATRLKEAATKAVLAGGSSYRNLDKFTRDMTARANSEILE
ncbi:linamarin synthase 1-like [Cryptomeria japonica]|uniref:linamarin synthase 1-like n=1 Tax=Cryptomeria japonica TaxID=3369 RepID=UPI0027DA5406|nr:linamarin synthase 1-like [Cryptomeria japonica]